VAGEDGSVSMCGMGRDHSSRVSGERVKWRAACELNLKRDSLFLPNDPQKKVTMSRYVPLICLALTHTLVDTCALLIAPLWPRLEVIYAFGVAGLSFAFIAQSLPTSISQLVFGFLRDRHPAPIWLWLGPVIAAVFLTTIGLIDQRVVLFTLLVFGGIGVGAFHPEAAVLAGRLLPGERTRGISVFMFGGSLGLALGPALSGFVVDRGGLPGLALLGPPILLLIVTLTVVGRRSAAQGRRADDVTAYAAMTPVERPTLSAMFDGRIAFALLLLLACSLRLVPNMAMDKVMAFVLERPEWGYSTQQVGLVQSIFLVAASVGMLGMTFRFRAGWEKAFLIGCPLTAIPLMLILSWQNCPPWLLFSTLAAAGFVLWGTSPAMVSYAQQQFPRGAGVASALTMGMAWGIGGLIQAPITSWYQSVGTPQSAFLAFIPCLLAAGGIAVFLPAVPQVESVGNEKGGGAETVPPVVVLQAATDEGVR
jgi:FSR family fosmidomycin resistance protein-like MFS transporter